MHSRLQELALAAALLLGTSCGNESSGPGEPEPPPPPPPGSPLAIALAPESGDGQEARAGQALEAPLRVLVTREGIPASDIEVHWTTSSGSLASAGPTGPDGIATAAWTLPLQEGSFAARAAIAGTPTSKVDFQATSLLPELRVVSGDGQDGPVWAELPDRLVVQVMWKGAPVEGEVVRWAVIRASDAWSELSGGPRPPFAGNVDPTSTTDAAGLSSAAWYLGWITGEYVARARLAAGGPAILFTAEASAGPPSQLSFEGSRAEPRPIPFAQDGTRLSAGVHDAYGNGIQGLPVTWMVKSGQATITVETGETNSHGWSEARLEFERDATEPMAVEVAVPGLEAKTRSFLPVDFVIFEGAWATVVDPGVVTVPAGTTVRWASPDGDHWLRPADLSLPGGPLRLDPLQVFTHRFDVPGTYLWICTQHDGAFGYEVMTVVVAP